MNTAGTFDDDVKIVRKQILEINSQDDVSVDFPEYRGMTFKEFWLALPRKLIHNIYIRRVENVGGELRNVEFATIPSVKDPWKELNPEPAAGARAGAP